MKTIQILLAIFIATSSILLATTVVSLDSQDNTQIDNPLQETESEIIVESVNNKIDYRTIQTIVDPEFNAKSLSYNNIALTCYKDTDENSLQTMLQDRFGTQKSFSEDQIKQFLEECHNNGWFTSEANELTTEIGECIKDFQNGVDDRLKNSKTFNRMTIMSCINYLYTLKVIETKDYTTEEIEKFRQTTIKNLLSTYNFARNRMAQDRINNKYDGLGDRTELGYETAELTNNIQLLIDTQTIEQEIKQPTIPDNNVANDQNKKLPIIQEKTSPATEPDKKKSEPIVSSVDTWNSDKTETEKVSEKSHTEETETKPPVQPSQQEQKKGLYSKITGFFKKIFH